MKPFRKNQAKPKRKNKSPGRYVFPFCIRYFLISVMDFPILIMKNKSVSGSNKTVA
jgi:hypothetical protein